jgi:muconolactone delta-isomerase
VEEDETTQAEAEAFHRRLYGKGMLRRLWFGSGDFDLLCVVYSAVARGRSVEGFAVEVARP